MKLLSCALALVLVAPSIVRGAVDPRKPAPSFPPAGAAFAFWWSAGSATIEDCRFVGNQATDEGGAAYCINYASNQPTAHFIRCTFTGNVAGHHGGALAIHNASSEIANCTIVKNTVTDSDGIGGGIFASGGLPAKVEHTIIAFNHAAGTGGAFLDLAHVACCDAYGNDGGDWGGIPDPTGSGGNISLDPRFCDYENRDFTLAEDSPCRPFSPPNPECDQIGAWPVACAPAALGTGAETDRETLSAFPNPFFGGCRISLGPVPRGAVARVTIHDPRGRIVRRFEERAGAGESPVLTWDGRDDEGREVASGIYLVRARVTGETRTARLIRAR